MNGKVCYYVIAQEGQDIYGFNEQSQSNEVCYVFEPIIYIPNAFTPGGLNPIFFPVINLANVQEYKLLIYDRWNNVIFSTDDIQTGWNGIMKNGQKAPFGVYGYQMTVSDGNGKDIRKMGHVTLIRSKED
jgi:gliding motility-associated-like protein